MYHTEFLCQQVHLSVWVAPGAIVVGDVTLHEDVSIWYNAVLRGDTEAIIVGKGSNIQDGAICHVDPGDPLIVGEGVTVGHGAILHGATIGDNSIVGMGAIVLNRAQVGENCIIGAGALLTSGKVFPAGSLILGSPAKVIRPLTPQEIEDNRNSARQYAEKARSFRGK